MPLTTYTASIPAFQHMFASLLVILGKAAAHAEAKKIDPAIFLQARLAPDMLPFVKQVQIASDAAKGCAARLAGVDIPSYADTETTFAELQERIAKTVAFLKTITPQQVEEGESRAVTLTFGKREMLFSSAQEYLLNFSLPHFYFHVSTAYAILRHNGVELGKADYLGMQLK